MTLILFSACGNMESDREKESHRTANQVQRKNDIAINFAIGVEVCLNLEKKDCHN